MKLMFIMIKIGVPAVMAVCLSCCSGHTAGGGNELKCRVMEVEGGYGYVVLHGADTLIYQPFIPALSGRLPFLLCLLQNVYISVRLLCNTCLG